MTPGRFGSNLGIYTAEWGEPENVLLEASHLQPDRAGGVSAEVSAYSTLDGGRDLLHFAKLGLLSTRSLDEYAKRLDAATPGAFIDWRTLLGGAAVQFVREFRAGDPPVLLRDVPRRSRPGHLLPFVLADQTSGIHGDGGDGKSLIALAAAASIQAGSAYPLGIEPSEQRNVLYVDWEFSPEEHRDRLERLCGADMPPISYVRCEAPLASEVERLQRIIRDRDIGVVVADSVAAGCDGPPEAAEVAMAYARGVRRLRVPTLLIAHTNRSGDESRPFGSTFWHNLARSTWFVKRSLESTADRLVVGMFNKKANTAALASPLGFELRFDQDRVVISRTDVRDVTDLADRLPLRMRMLQLLRSGPMTYAEIATQTGESVDTVSKAARRGDGDVFTRVPVNGIYKVALLESQREEAA